MGMETINTPRKEDGMFKEIYCAENTVITKDEYAQMRQVLCSKDRNIKPAVYEYVRRIYFNKDINYLTESTENQDEDVFYMEMKDWNLRKLRLMKKSVRDGMIFKAGANITEEQFLLIAHGDYEWMKESRDGIMNECYMHLLLNQMRIGVVVDCVKESYKLNSHNEYIIFDHDTTSTYLFSKDTLLSPKLRTSRRLENGNLIMTFRQSASVSKIVASMTTINQHYIPVNLLG